MLENLNTVQDLTKQIEQLRAGEDRSEPAEGVHLTPGQWWHRLLELSPQARMTRLEELLKCADKGLACEAYMHEENLEDLRQHAVLVSHRSQQWQTARRLLSIYVQTLRKDAEGDIGRGHVADKLELFLTSGEELVDNRCRRVLCGHTWTEAGRTFECAEPVGPDGGHFGEHYAYVREGSAADEELRMQYLEEENRELRARLGLPPNPART